jgi:plasmid stability protein
MKNVTVSMDDETYRRARVRAAEAGKSVSAMVRAFLNSLGTEETHFERLKREEAEIRAQIKNFSASDRLSRDEVHERRR